MAKKQTYVMVCPKCKSPDIYMDKSNPLQPAMGVPAMYICNRCEHSGYNFPEVSISELEKFEKKAKKEKLTDAGNDKTPKVDTAYGRFEVKIFWKLTAPVTFLIGAYLIYRGDVSGIILALAGLFMIYASYFRK